MKSLLKALKHSALIALLAVTAAPALAAVDLVGDDTDLFTTNPNIPSSIPNVLIVLDNTSNWNAANQGWPAIVDAECNAFLTNMGTKQGDAEICAIYKVTKKLSANVRVGMSMYADSSNAAGYVRFPMLAMTDANKADLHNALFYTTTNNPRYTGPSSMAPGRAFNDAFRYFNSLGTYTGVPALDPGNLDPPVDQNPPQADVRGYTSSARTVFKFPADANTNACGYDYIIFIGNGFPSKDNNGWPAELQAAAALLNDPAVTPNLNVIQNTGVNPDVWSRFLFQYGVKVNTGIYRHVTTHTLNVCKDQCSADWQTVLENTAHVSQGLYRKATDLDSIVKALTDIFEAIQAVNSVFAATTLPVSINVRGTNLNQVYIGVFRPDAQLSPRWWGNLKQYRLGVANASTGALQLVDTNGAAAVNLNTGFVLNTATSIWSETVSPAGSGFWAFRGPNYEPTDSGKDQDAPDGDLVEKGGAAQKIRQVYPLPDSTVAQTRKIYTCTGTCTAGSTLSSYLFNNANTDVTSTALGTFITQSVTSVTASGQTATVTMPVNTFVAGDQVVIAGAIPSLYNSASGSFFTVLSSPAPTATTFSYSVAPATPDATRAYVNFPVLANNKLTPGTDLVTVTGATPAGYNVTNAAISAVVGNANQFSYALSPTYPTTAASGYTVTGVRRVGTGNMVWNSGTNRVTVTLTNHGFLDGGNVTVTGASPADFNVPNGSGSGAITVTGANSFTFPLSTVPLGGTTTSAIATLNAHGYGSGDTLVITGATPAAFNTAAAGSALTNVNTNDFTYTTSATVSGNATVAGQAQKRVASDVHSYPVTAASSTGTGANLEIILTLNVPAATSLVAGQIIHPFAVNDLIAVKGVTCLPQGGGSRTCATTTADPPAAGSGVFTITVTAVSGSGASTQIRFKPGGNLAAGQPTISSAKVFWTGPSLSTAKTLTSTTAGPTVVTATGTIYVQQAGDLTSKVNSIANQASATGTITAARFGSSDAAERTALINWVRGIDNKDNENQNANPADVRASVHGDVLHSRPAVINYNRTGTDDDVFIYYGTNGGMLHAIKGGSLANGGGKEQWTFVAPEFFGKLKRLRDQSPRISSLAPRDYFFDGSIAVYTRDAGKDGKIDRSVGGAEVNDKVYLFVTMRRGGRLLYAFDVTDPANPILKWKKGCREATGSGTTVGTGDCDVGFGEMGQTWGQPQLGYLRKWPTTLALIVGAGYDKPVEDFQPCMVTNWTSTSVTAVTGVALPATMDAASCPPAGGTSVTVNRSQGRGIYILNAETGAILWTAGRTGSGATKEVAGMDYSIVGDIAALRKRSNTANRVDNLGFESVPIGYLDRLYATDTGGNVWRVDVADTSASPNFPVHKVASVAVAPAVGTHAALNYRKFTVQPDVVYSSDTNGSYDAVLLGSGDREHVWDFIVTNRFYMFKDRDTGTLTASDTPQATITDTSTDLYTATGCLQDASVCSANSTTQAADQTALLNAKGWRLNLNNIGEKTVAPATTAAGTVIFNTHQPKEDTITGQSGNTGTQGGNFCTAALGTARQYGISYKDATATNIFSSLPANMVSASGAVATFAGGGFLPQPVPAVVEIGGRVYQTVIAGVQTTNPGGLTLQHRVRTYWYRRTD